MTKFQPMLKTRSFIHHFPFIFSTSLLLLITFPISLKEGLTEEILKYTNEFRKSKGLQVLVMRNDLNAIARKHSEDMALGRNSFGHTGYDQRQLQIQKLIRPFHGMAENVAYGVANGQQVVSLWKNSSGHRRNLLGDYKYIGIGTARDRRGTIFFTQIFVR
jgi:uncharacterized protein YkwD